jgi:DNA-binding MarR family transcriptional regulator
MSEVMSFRGYDVEDYDVAIQAAIEIGWVEAAEIPGTFRPTQKGRDLREQVEQLTDEYFFRPWSVLKDEELAELSDLLTRLRDQLGMYNRSN